MTMRLRPGNSTREIATETIGLRDRALLLIGFAGALRRSELVGLDVSDLTKTRAGSRLRIGASKTEQEHQGATVTIAPQVEAHATWRAVSRISMYPLGW